MTAPDPQNRSVAAAPAAHARHDTFLVAAHAAGDLDGASRSAAESQVAGCTACSALYEDLRAIAGATKSLSNVTIPASAAGRDFRLTPEQAARLDRGRGWRRLLAPLAGSGLAWTRPLAGAVTTIGLAGVLLTTVLPGVGGLASGGASSSAPERLTVQTGGPTPAVPVVAGPTAAPAPAAGGVPDAGGGTDATSGPSTAVDEFGPAAIASAPNASAEAAGVDTAGRTANSHAPAPSKSAGASGPEFAAGGAPAESAAGPTSNAQDGMKYEPLQQTSSQGSWLPIASVALMLLGLALFGLRFVARRLS
jgi:hypothetical protein